MTHKVTGDKISEFREQKISVIEIDLSKQQMLSEEQLTTLLCDSTEHKAWLYNRKLDWISGKIKSWEEGIKSDKFILFTPKQIFRNQEEIDNSIILRPKAKNDENIIYIAECPRKIHYSHDHIVVKLLKFEFCIYL